MLLDFRDCTPERTDRGAIELLNHLLVQLFKLEKDTKSKDGNFF
jgi:hypothetical protein